MSIILKIVKNITVTFPIPGTTYLAKLVTKLFAPKSGKVQGNIANYHYAFDIHDELQLLMYFGLYDVKETRLLRRILHEGDVFIDVGANVGYYSLVGSQLVGENGQVYAFEPIPENANVLERAIDRNRIKNIDVHQVAIGDRNSMLTLYIPEEKPKNTGWASVVPSMRRKKSIEVNQITLDDFLLRNGSRSARLIKMDIEGAEFEALSGMKNQLTKADAPDILCEMNGYLLAQRNIKPIDLIELLVDMGYQVYDVNQNQFDYRNFQWSEGHLINLFFTKSQK